MLAQGWLEEVCALIGAGLPEDAKPFDFIGYRELRSVLRGEMKIEDAKAAIQQATRRYAKRQVTWFRREAGVAWLDGFGDDPRSSSRSSPIGKRISRVLASSDCANRAPFSPRIRRNSRSAESSGV